MRQITLIAFFSILSIITNGQKSDGVATIAQGKMPAMTKDKSNNIHIVYGTGDSIMYLYSKDANTFSRPALVAVLPGLFASAMRGPQIAAAGNTIIITACTNTGNIFSYQKDATGRWNKGGRVNETNEIAKEALMGLGADGNIAYAVFLGVKKPKGQIVYGAKSVDGGKTWSKSMIVYDSPDGSVCECCKPSVVVRGNTVAVMFRNLIAGNRDLYLARSTTGGNSFANAQKLGDRSWKLNGCPMDGGGLAIAEDNTAETVWRREGKIYASAVGKPEKEIGEGRGCTIETIKGKKVYAWGQNGDVIVRNDAGQTQNLGKGGLPSLKAISANKVLCIWENEDTIQARVVNL